jgi:toxin CptA
MSSSSFADSGSFGLADLGGSLEFRPRPSRLLARFLLVAHALAAVVVLVSVPGRLAMAVLLGLVLVSFYRAYRRHVLQVGRRAARRVVCQEDGAWFLQDTQGVVREARLLPSTFLHPRLVILNFELCRCAGRRNLVLCPDSLDPQTLRRLRARLRRVTTDPKQEPPLDRAA